MGILLRRGEGPCDTRNVPSFLANVRGKSSTPEGAFASVSNPSHSSHLFSAQNRQFLHIGGPEDVIRLSLAYLGLLSWSVRSLARPLPERAFDDDATAKQTTTNEYFCINLISSRAFSGSKEGRIRSMDGSLLEQPFCIKTRSSGRRKEGRTRGLEAEIPVGIAYE